MVEKPLVSIITVVYNGERYLQQTIDSVYNQTYKNVEYLIIDGGSTDNTIEIIKKNQTKVSFWQSEPDKGLYDAMNKGIDKASGELIGIVNSDDWYENNTIQIVVERYLQNKNKKVFHADRYDVYPDGTRKIYAFNPSTLKFKYFAMTYNHPTMFIHRSLYKDHQYNTALSSLSDYQLTLELYLKNKNLFEYINQPITNFRLGGISANISFFELLKENYIARRNAGLSYIQCVVTIFVRFFGEIYRRIKMK